VTIQVELNEMRMDAKIDMLHSGVGAIGETPRKVGLPSYKSGEDDARVWGSEEVSRVVLLHKYLPLERPSCVVAGREWLIGR